MAHKLFPCLWFNGQAKAAADYYCSVFKNSKKISENPMVVIFELNETKFMALNGGPHFNFTPANSYVITCDTQEEIDHYWEKLGDGGKYSQCGWLDDKFGVSWQIVPAILGELMSNPEKSQKVTEAFMQMTKFDIQKLINVKKTEIWLLLILTLISMAMPKKHSIFYKSVFGGEFAKVMRFKDMASDEFPVAEHEANKIMHIALPIGKNVLMANDVPEILGKTNENENRSKISISAESKEEANKLFNGLSAGGQIEMHMEDSPWGSYFGMFRDKYGIEWMIDYDPQYMGQL
jgi:predicted 3-demethylubiquinone-9 3-methyltransferase (glyoxalase superfamily)